MFTTILVQPLANGLVVFYKMLFSDMGLAIIGFSIFLRFILNPLTKPYMESMKKMKDVAPSLEKLKKKYKDDKVKLTKAQADLYKTKGINPGAGCLPYLLQIVVLIAFFNMFNKTLSAENPTEAFNTLLYAPLKFAEGVLINTKFFWVDMTKPAVFQIPGLGFNLPGPLLILSAFVQFISAKIMAPYEKEQAKIAKKTPGSGDDFQVAMQKSMMYMFPMMTLFIGLQFPAGLALYWLVFSFFQAYQQYATQGWGGMTPWLIKLGLIKSESNNKNGKKN